LEIGDLEARIAARKVLVILVIWWLSFACLAGLTPANKQTHPTWPLLTTGMFF
jgi:hypothetical protein